MLLDIDDGELTGAELLEIDGVLDELLVLRELFVAELDGVFD